MMLPSWCDGLCRICLKLGAQHPLRPEPARRLAFCYHLQLQDDDELPDKLCNACLLHVNAAYKFINKYLTAQFTLEKLSKSPDLKTDSEIRNALTKLDKSPDNSVKKITKNKSATKKLKSNTSVGNVATKQVRILPKMVASVDASNKVTIPIVIEPKKVKISEVPKICLLRNPRPPTSFHQCQTCRKQFVSAKFLQIHMEQTHRLQVSTTVSCSLCNINFPNRIKLTQHNLKEHFNSKTTTFHGNVVCRICDKEFKHKYLLNRHFKRLHTQLKRTHRVCPNCRKTFVTLYELHSHQKTCESEEQKSPSPAVDLSCKVCKINFADVADLKAHTETHVANLCEYCNRGFVNVPLLLEHISDSHNCLDARYCCVRCSDNFSTKKALSEHQRLSSHGQLFCAHCDPSRLNFADVRTLCEHIATAHNFNGEKDNIDIVEHSYLPDQMVKGEIGDVKNLLTKQSFGVNDQNGKFVIICSPNSSRMENFFNDKTLMKDAEDSLHHIEMDCDGGFSKGTAITSNAADTDNDVNYRNVDFKPVIVESHLLADYESKMGESASVVDDSKTPVHVSAAVDNKESAKKSVQSVQCNLCSKRFSRIFNLQKHMEHHDGVAPTCLGCGFSAENDVDLKKHIKQCNTFWTLNNLVCPTCGKKLTTVAGLRYHRKTHSSVKKYSCDICQRFFLTSGNLNAHLRTVHSQKRPYTCSACPRSFTTSDHLKKHVTSAHMCRRDFVCRVCDRGFTQSSHLTQHMWMHTGVKPHKCPHCSNNYTAKCSLNKHLRRNHLAESSEVKPSADGINLSGLNKSENCNITSLSANLDFDITSPNEKRLVIEEMNDDLLDDINIVIVGEDGDYLVENIENIIDMD
ncbi:uncharacterized protein LOC143912785 [Arctopsyche grandis]|uniref:uncharacterized protein LOC143912785 n=1 Tax=Arctopsyche grandis TaxID=121162 RepID=UPI00406D9E13